MKTAKIVKAKRDINKDYEDFNNKMKSNLKAQSEKFDISKLSDEELSQSIEVTTGLIQITPDKKELKSMTEFLSQLEDEKDKR